MAFPDLSSSLQLGSIELPHRIVHAPTDISSSHAVFDRRVMHYAGGH